MTTEPTTTEPTTTEPTTTEPTTTDDEAARSAIRSDLGASLFVEAGAGAGKTSELVRRITALVVEAGVPIREVAAITFTDKAASELRDRVRAALERHAATGDAAARVALDELDDAAIGTLHGFAQRLLVEHPVEVGLPPAIEVLDEVSSQLAFADRWSRAHDRMYERPELERTLLLAAGCGIGEHHLRELAHLADDNWDLVAERCVEPPVDPPPLSAARLVAAVRAVVDRSIECTDDTDALLGRLGEFAVFADALDAAGDEVETLDLLRDSAPSHRVSTRGRKGNWPDIAAIRAEVVACGALKDQIVADLVDPVLRRITHEVASFTLRAADERRREGRLEFHDLLVLARALLRDPTHGAAVRAQLARRYRRLLLDEFQDTDPIQIDLAVLLTSDDPSAHERPWHEVVPEPGRLFVVGDPKQSIYRFRRADIEMFLRARTSLESDVIELSRNFRTVAPVIDYVNHVFSRLIAHKPGAQPEYRPLVAVRGAPPVGPPVALLGVAPIAAPAGADVQREAEAEAVAGAISTAIAQGWSVDTNDETPDGSGWRPAAYGDVCVLLPARTSLPFLERALDAVGIPYRAETSSLVYTTREVRELLLALRAVDDPTDSAAMVSTLRSSLYGCGDDDLFDYKVTHRGSWSLHAPAPTTLPGDHPVVQGIAHLRSLHDDRHWHAPSELLERLVRDRRVLEQGFATRRPRDLWRRVRFVIDQARAFADAGGGGLRDFLRWADQQSIDGARVVEAVLPETDDDAVRILTIHGAKGLEFPITILSGMTTEAGGRRSGVRLAFPPTGGFAVRFSTALTTAEFDQQLALDEQMDFEERLRLLYVAATRARDHLVVSVHRPAKPRSDDPARATYAQIIWKACGDATEVWAESDPETARRGPGDTPPQRSPTHVGPAIDIATWRAERAALLHRARVPRSLSATAIASAAAATTAAVEPEPVPQPEPDDPGLRKDPRDLELPPWQRGRYGTAIGRAVHAVLQTIDLTTAEGLDTAVAAQAAAEGVLGAETRIAALVRSALASDTVRAAIDSGAVWRESYVATTIGDRIVEGYVDLVYRSSAGLVVVDYKTDAIASEADLAAKLDRYRLQGATYALAMERATSEPVAAMVFVFCTEGAAREVAVGDLAAAMAEVEAITRS